MTTLPTYTKITTTDPSSVTRAVRAKYPNAVVKEKDDSVFVPKRIADGFMHLPSFTKEADSGKT